MREQKSKDEAMKQIILTKKREALGGKKATKPSVEIVTSCKNMAKYERLAEIKTEIDELQKTYDTIFEKIQMSKEGLLPKVQTSFGVLSLNKRSSTTILDMLSVFKRMGQKLFLENCSIGKSGIVAAIGEVGFQQLETSKAVVFDKDGSIFYRLLKDKDNGK